jgi:hypothetical protein
MHRYKPFGFEPFSDFFYSPVARWDEVLHVGACIQPEGEWNCLGFQAFLETDTDVRVFAP